MKQSEAIKWYSRTEIASAIVKSAENKEVAFMLQSGSYGRRPKVLQFPADVKSFARDGATSFHISIENFSDPLKLGPETTEHMLTELRQSWDLIIDIDCPWFEYSKKTAKLIIEYLHSQGLKNIGLKFSGNKGWHICVPAESFPKKIARTHETRKLFPLLLGRLLKKLRIELNEYLNKSNPKYFESDLDSLFKKTGKKREEITKNGKIDFLKLMDIDLAMASPRHLIRSPYSLHEKSGLASVVIKPEELESFKREDAKLENVKEIRDFFNRQTSEPNEAKNLFSGISLEETEKYETKYERTFEPIKVKLNNNLFPPCIKRIINGLEDGRKRALFALINLYKNFDIPWDELEEKIYEWNEKNTPPLKKGYIQSQLTWHKRQRRRLPPPNCKQYYKDIGVCFPDDICKRIKNPLTYVNIKTRPTRRKRKQSVQS